LLFLKEFMSKNVKQTSSGVSSQAGKALQSAGASSIAKSLAGSALAQSGTGKQTGAAMERSASQALQSRGTSAATKTLAASVVSQSNKKR
jgi:hypothetical protein